MTDQKVIFIIPGFLHTPSSKAYQAIARTLQKQGFLPFLITIPWKDSTITENTEYFLRLYKSVSAKEKYILGFSFGAMIAFLAATKIKPAGLILCSLSPYFKQDVGSIKRKQLTPLSKKRFIDFSHLDFTTLAGKVKAKKVLMVYGAKEAKSLIKRVNEAFDQISTKKKYLVSIKKTQHNLADKRYIDTLNQLSQFYL